MLDVMMPGINGIEAARELRQWNTYVKIIFLTSSAEFAVESYAVGAYYYLLKPVSAQSLLPLIDRIEHEQSERKKDSLVLKCATGIACIEFRRLEFVESMDKALVFHLADGRTLKSRTSLQEMTKALLQQECFLRPHRSYIVNMAFIHNLTNRGIELKSGTLIPLPHGRLSETKEAFLRYAFRKEQGQ